MLLLTSSCSRRAGARVGLGALAANGQPLAVADAAVALDLHQTLDIQRHVTAKVALHDDVVLVQVLADQTFLLGGQILHAGVGINVGSRQDLLGGAGANAIDVSQAYFDPLFAGQVNAGNTCHSFKNLLK